MKKQLTALLTATLLLTSLTGCTNENSSTADNSSVADTSNSVTSDSSSSSSESENSTDSTSSDESDFMSETTSEAPTDVVRVRYEDTEIPNIHCETGDSEGRVSFKMNNARINGTLDGIIFETHTMGDYTITLIGDGVRTDSANFPDKIFAKDLYIEVTKNGTLIEDGIAHCCDSAFGVSDFSPEKTLFKDKIGSYVDGYELERPVIAMRYFFPDDGREVKNFVEFFDIYKEALCGGHVNIHAPKTGVVLTGGPDIKLSRGEHDDTFPGVDTTGIVADACRLGTFTAEEFTIIDSKTLEDTAAGVRYNFNFTDPPEAMLYSTTLI